EQTEIYDDGYLRVEHENYYVACNGQNVRLPRAEFLIFSRLVRTPLRFVSAEELWQAAWATRKNFNAVSLHVYVYRLRRKFEPFGLTIETMVNVGYCFTPLETAMKTAQTK
ncbi:MAG: helix-turn-helix domain-containing protein, partial [Pyrinomonadaceae bacterium]